MRRAGVALIALAAAASLVIGLAPVGAQEPPGLPTTFPENPRALDGGDPFAALPGPVECDPELAARPGAYFPLSQLPRRRTRSPFAVGAGIVSYELDLTNRKSQRFRIYVSAASNAGAVRYIARASICLERFAYPDSIPDVVEPVRYDELLVAAAGQVAQLSSERLLALRKQLGSDASFAELLEAAGTVPDAVVDAAAALAAGQLAAKVAAGELTAAEVAALDLRQRIDDLADAPNAGFPSDPAEAPASPVAKGRWLRRAPVSNVVVGMVEVAANKRPSVIWYAVDPPVAGPYTISSASGHNYTARCTTNGWTRVQASQNGSWVKLKRSGTEVGRAYDHTSTFAASRTLSRPSTTLRTFDIYVWTGYPSSKYSVSGGWTRGAGGGC